MVLLEESVMTCFQNTKMLWDMQLFVVLMKKKEEKGNKTKDV